MNKIALLIPCLLIVSGCKPEEAKSPVTPAPITPAAVPEPIKKEAAMGAEPAPAAPVPASLVPKAEVVAPPAAVEAKLATCVVRDGGTCAGQEEELPCLPSGGQEGARPVVERCCRQISRRCYGSGTPGKRHCQGGSGCLGYLGHARSAAIERSRPQAAGQVYFEPEMIRSTKWPNTAF